MKYPNTTNSIFLIFKIFILLFLPAQAGWQLKMTRLKRLELDFSIIFESPK